mmetsp:Transcript_6898/g.13290  ORF Transcript_6898/g.13290 Transcript_6898/m.13290 type:complete len:121 (+) Transcript_6898:41-403(+)
MAKQCQLCEDTTATLFCKQCNEAFCSECFEALHWSGKRQGHEVFPVGEVPGAAPAAPPPPPAAALFCLAERRPAMGSCSLSAWRACRRRRRRALARARAGRARAPTPRRRARRTLRRARR